MTKAQETKLDTVCTKVEDIHKTLFEDGLVHDVGVLKNWKRNVNSVLLKILYGIAMLLVGGFGSMLIFYIRNSKP